MHKKEYVLFYENFVLYQKLGLKVTKIHKVVKFEQDAWLRPFIDFNLDKRKEFPAIGDLFKLANNSVFGKTMENVRKYRKVNFVTDSNRIKRILGEPFYYDFEYMSDDCVMIECKNKTVKLNKPIYCGMKILDISKFHMYDVWYNLLKPEFGDKLSLILMDTDSFVFAVLGMNEEEYNSKILNYPKLRNYFDFSKFPKDHILYTGSNTECGKMKSEREGGIIYFGISLKAKMYHLNLPNKKKCDTQKMKGTTKSVKDKIVNWEHYLGALLGDEYYVKNQTRIQVKKHDLFTMQEDRKALSSDDTKRYITEDRCITRAIGHYKNITH
jgi:hypothetical protein